MPPINPQQLLKALGPLLTETGGIKGAQEADRIARLMKDASKLVTRCVYLNILRATESEDAFTSFIDVGGWDILNTWLDMARNENNSPLLGELLEVYLRIPVTVALLKQNTAAKTIKKMQGKTDNDKIKTLSTQLVDVWMKKIRGQNNGVDSADADDKKKKKKDHEKDKKDIRRSKDEKEGSDKHKSHHDDDKKERDKHKDKDRSRRDKTKSDSKDSSKSSSSSSSSSHSKHKDSPSSSSKKSSSVDSKLSTPTADKSKSDPGKEEEGRRRPKTVKQIGSRIRSTGLFDEDDEEDEPVKKPVDKSGIKRLSQEPKSEEPSEKKPRLHLTMPSYTSSSLSSTTTTPPEVMHGRIKIIPPKKPPAHEIQESNVFMDALQQSSYASLGIKKKKKLTSPSATTPPVLAKGLAGIPTLTAPTISTSQASSPPLHGAEASEPGPTSPPLLSPTTALAQKLPSVPSFYRDTLAEKAAESDKKEEKKEEGRDSPPALELMRPPDSEAGQDQDVNTSKSDEPALDFDNAEADQDVNMAEPPRPSKPKKKVTWARESQMEEVFYFEMDENERENVNRPKSFSDLKKEEMMSDRRAMESAKRFNNDTMVEVLQWKLPKMIDNVIVVVEPGCNSVERQIQMEREQSVLCALFFNKVPDTPNEPDAELLKDEDQLKIIPLEDENGSCTEYEHTYNFNDPSSLPYDPEFGALPLQATHPTNNHGNANNVGHAMNNLPPAISHVLHVLQQQAQETRDPVMQTLQGNLTSVLQTTNPQDSGMLVERIMNAMEPFVNQIPGLSALISSVKGNGMDHGGRFMGPPPAMGGHMGGNPRHGLLGSAPPGFNMEGGGGGGGNMRPGMPSGPPPMMNNGGNNFYMGGDGGGGGGGGGGGRNMHMGGPPHGHWRGGGRSRPFKRGNRGNTVCMFYAKSRNCKYGDNCQFLHPNS